jgi:Concanavalin A-like lectin/glucanases superfamily
VLADTSGKGNDGTLSNASGGAPVGFTFGTGVFGKALGLSAADKAYVGLPKGLVSKLSEVTLATWVKLKSASAFQRIFELGLDANTFMYLVNASGNGVVRFRIATATKNQVVEGAAAVPVSKWAHVAVTLGDSGVSVYLDGALVAQQAPATLRPSDLGDTGNNYIGRSPFAQDPYLDGQVDEVRIYNRVLSAAEIAELAKSP